MSNGATKRGITADDLYRFTYVSDPQLSPDGATVAFVRTTVDREADGYRAQVWVVPADGSAPPRRFTAGPNDSAPRWSPDGQTLAFLARRGGKDAKAQVWLIGAAWRRGLVVDRCPRGRVGPGVVARWHADRLHQPGARRR